jgi:glycosyltransferase involved in cell wall biosynthesis
MTTLLSINNYYYYRGGAETVFLDHNRMFERRGWRVVPFAMHHRSNLPSDWDEHFIQEIEFGEHYTMLEKIARVPKVIYSLEARRKLRGLIDLVKPALAHGHNLYHHLSPSVLAELKARGVPTVLTLHDLKLACPESHMLTHDGICERCKGGRTRNVLLHRCIKNSPVLSGIVMLEAMVNRALGSYRRGVDRYVVPSRFYIDKLREWDVANDSFVHVPNFVDAHRYEPRFEPGEAFVYFGRLSPEKGVATLVRAVGMAGCRLTIIGAGRAQPALEELARECNAQVEFAGYMTGKLLHRAVAAARAVVLPSEWYENAPMTILEAYALGKPVLGARIGGVPELIRENRTGATFASRDAGELAALLHQWSQWPDDRIAAMGLAGRRWVEQEFNADKYRERIEEVYRGLGVS